MLPSLIKSFLLSKNITCNPVWVTCTNFSSIIIKHLNHMSLFITSISKVILLNWFLFSIAMGGSWAKSTKECWNYVWTSENNHNGSNCSLAFSNLFKKRILQQKKASSLIEFRKSMMSNQPKITHFCWNCFKLLKSHWSTSIGKCQWECWLMS